MPKVRRGVPVPSQNGGPGAGTDDPALGQWASVAPWLAMDEAQKLGRSRFALGSFSEADGPGSQILFSALGVIDSLGGTADATAEAVTDLLTREDALTQWEEPPKPPWQQMTK